MILKVSYKGTVQSIKEKTDYLKPLKTDSDSEEDAHSKTKVAKTFSDGMDEFKDLVLSTKSNRKHKEIAQQKYEVSDTEASKQVVEDVMHRPKVRLERMYLNISLKPSAQNHKTE